MSQREENRTGTRTADPAKDEHDQSKADSVQMCCDDSGRTADQHRAESADGKCCSDG